MEDKKFPASLNSDAKKMKKARQLVEQHLSMATTGARYASFQGMFSKTIIVSLKDSGKAVIQFRYEPLDPTPFHHAFDLLGDLVPQVQLLKDDDLEAAEIWPVYLTYIPGDTWVKAPNRRSPEFGVRVMTSLGEALARCFVPGSSKDAVDSYVVPKLQRILASDRSEIQPFRRKIQELIDEAHDLDTLPLFYSHLDLNEMNILVSSNGKLTGIVDWELAPPPAPFGMGLCRIHDLTGYYEGGTYFERENSEDMERSLWNGISALAPADVKTTLEANSKAIQKSFTIGAIFDALSVDEGGDLNKVAVRALPKFLTYRIPQIRGQDPPFQG